MRVSIVICTYNRAQGLDETLESLRHQNHDDFEVIVVNGPSTDHTEEVLARWSDRVVIDRCPVANLSVSRNIGIRATSGDIIAFIDDDALPDFDWLQQALPAFSDPEVAGVGGIVFDHTGVALQYKYSAANRFAETAARHDRPYDDQCAPGSFQFPYLQGTNALFRRDALLEIGGFDETFDYYLDETDVCCRLVDAGYTLRQLDNAAVHHKFLPSGVRDHQRVVRNWFPIMKNQVYFSYRHALDPFSEFDILEHSTAFLHGRVADARFHEEAGRLPPNAANHAAMACAQAMRVGMQLGWERRHLRLGPATWERHTFKQFPTVELAGRRKLTLVTSGYTGNMTGGIARFFSDLAPALARRGHEVRVITRATGPAAVDLEDGVWVHRIESPSAGESGVAPNVLPHINDFATAVVGEIERIGTWSSHDVVYGPLWDVEILGVLRRSMLPVAIQVATPLAVAADMAGNMADSDIASDMRKIMTLEREVLDDADMFHANSAAVSDTVAAHYAGTFEPERWNVVHLGLIDHGASDTERPAVGRRLTVLFVGRFEVRKGIDTFLDAVEAVAPDFPEVDFVAAGEDRALAPGQPLFGESWRASMSSRPWIDQVRFAGSVTDDELHDLYRNADVVVLPSRYESFGLVMVEAMMHGKALISCDTSGIRDVVRDGIDGILVQPGDVDAVTQNLRALLSDPDRRAELGEQGRRRFVEAFHIDRFAERFENFIAHLGLRDASTLVLGGDDAATLSVGSSGRPVALVESGGDLRFSRRTGAASTLVMCALEDSVVEVDGRRFDLAPGAASRLPILVSSADIVMRVIEGHVEVGGLIEVERFDR